jgi:hypothetical protein
MFSHFQPEILLPFLKFLAVLFSCSTPQSELEGWDCPKCTSLQCTMEWHPTSATNQLSAYQAVHGSNQQWFAHGPEMQMAFSPRHEPDSNRSSCMLTELTIRKVLFEAHFVDN